jgi:RNA polymerase sigma-70 factor (ECF subfamily)
VQQTFVAAIAAIPTYQHRSQKSFEAWLGTIAEHQAQNIVAKLRRLKRGGQWEPAAAPGRADRSSWLALADLVAASSGETPSSRLAADEAVQAMQVAVAGLPADQRAAVALHHLEGKSVEATAAELARTPGAVRGLLQRASRSLREALGHSSRWFDKKR